MARVIMLVENNTYPQDVRVRSEAQSLVRAGHQVVVIAPRGDGQSRRERVGGVDVSRFALPSTSANALGYLAEYAIANARLYLAGAWQLVRGAEVIHLHNPPDTLFGVGLLARALGRDVVFDHHDLAPELFEAKFGRSGPAAGLLRLLERLSFRTATLVITPNESHKEIAMQRAGVPAGRIAVVRNGPPRATLGAATDPRDGALTDPHLVFLGGMELQDGVDDLVPMFTDLVQRGFPRARLTLVGEGSRRTALEKRFAAAGLSDQVRFTGFVAHTEVAGLLSEADICLDPAPCTELNDHSTMVKVAEYMAARRPVVCFPLLETRRTASDAAAFAECGDVASMTDQVAALARDPERRLKLAQQGYERASDLTWDASEVNLLAAYDRLRRHR